MYSRKELHVFEEGAIPSTDGRSDHTPCSQGYLIQAGTPLSLYIKVIEVINQYSTRMHFNDLGLCLCVSVNERLLTSALKAFPGPR